MSELSISVAMATFNGARFIREQLDSLAAQTVHPAELVIADDGSTDATLSIAEDFARVAPFRVRVLRNPDRLGWADNFMHVASLCTSELIAFCDQDDIWYPGKLEAASRAFADQSVVLFCHDVLAVTASREAIAPVRQLPAGARSLPPLTTDPWMGALGFTEVFRRSLLEFSHLRTLSTDHNSPGSRMAHDQWVFFLAAVLGTIVYEPEPLAEYRQHGNNICGWHSMGSADRLQQRLRPLDSSLLATFASASQGRVHILRSIEREAGGVWQARAREASIRYGAIAKAFDLRARLYASTSMRARAWAFVELLAAGAYGRKGPWTLSVGSMIKDLAYGVRAGIGRV